MAVKKSHSADLKAIPCTATGHLYNYTRSYWKAVSLYKIQLHVQHNILKTALCRSSHYSSSLTTYVELQHSFKQLNAA
jgi:hypothetical protein